MRKSIAAPTIDIDLEIDHLVSYLESRWVGIPTPKELFTQIREIALQDNHQWFDDSKVQIFLIDKSEAREKLLKQTLPEEEARGCTLYDQSLVRIYDIYRSVSKLKQDILNAKGEWDFETRVTTVYREILKKFPDLKDARPLGWEALRKRYSDFKGMTEYANTQQDADEKDFKGFRPKGYNRSFVIYTALPYVMYDDVCQDRPAPLVLVMAVYSHFMAIAEQRNTTSLLKAIQKIDWKEKVPQMVFDVPLESEHPLLKKLIDIAYKGAIPTAAQAEENYRSMLERKKEFEAKPLEEQNQARANAAQEVLDLLRSALGSLD